MNTERATIRPATFDEAEHYGYDGTLRTGGKVYILQLADGTHLACESGRTRYLNPDQEDAR